MKPASINSFINDSLTLRVAVFDEFDEPFGIEENKITKAQLHIPKVNVWDANLMEGNQCLFFIPSHTLTAPGIYPFHVIIQNDAAAQYTIAHGTINVKDPTLT